jgi:hypothetical protein
MRAVIFVPDCCGRVKMAADVLKLPMGVRMKLDDHMCGKMYPEDAVKEIVQLCKKADGRRLWFGWTLIVESCEWSGVEEVVMEAGGDIVYMTR